MLASAMRAIGAALLSGITLCSAATPSTDSQNLSGLWDASVQVGKMTVPCKFGMAQHGGAISAWFFNGTERVRSASGELTGRHLVVDFATYARRLDATVNADGTIEGTYAPTTPHSTSRTYGFRAQRALTEAATPGSSSAHTAPSIAGEWLIPAPSEKVGEKAWRMVVRQSGTKVSAAILRIDGDTGELNGTWHQGTLVLSHFDGARPSLFDITPGPNDTLRVIMHDSTDPDAVLTAYRPGDAVAKGLPAATDPLQHTRMRDPSEPFQFRFPDLQGQLVSNADARFKGKVLIIDVAGSWCPNCHDEAPVLEALYRQYRARGLEIVMLSFEEPAQLANPTRLRTFIKTYGIDYTVLLAGAYPDQLQVKLPQVVDLDSYPTTFFIGRDGRVRAVHAGFASPATGHFNDALKRDFATRIEALLAERRPHTGLSAHSPG
jgi:thiol-disulfide isomerase/thioredoxin